MSELNNVITKDHQKWLENCDHLLKNIKTNIELLTKARQKLDNEGEEPDKIYRWMHTSFKTYRLHDNIKEIVYVLQSLDPREVPAIGSEAKSIIDNGLNKHFNYDDNKDWFNAVAPVILAYFSAKYFLDMAIRCYQMEEVSGLLPSDWAALLYFYGLR